MNDRPNEGQADRPDRAAGLCALCRHAGVVRTDRGGRFVRCALSDTDDRFARYPVLPVRWCPGVSNL
jgi:hypothetical protein